MTPRIEPFLIKYDSKNWILLKILLKELNPFQHMTRRIEHFSTEDSKNWTFFSIELFQYDRKRLNFFNMFWRVEPFFWYDLKNGLFGKMSQIFEPFLNMTQRIEFLSYDSNNWALFWKLAHRIEFFEVILSIEFFFSKKRTLKELKELNPSWKSLKGLNFFCWKYESKNWTFLSIWLKELLQPFFFMIQILGPFSHDSKNWTFFFTWIKYLNFFENFWFKEMDPFFQDSKIFHQ